MANVTDGSGGGGRGDRRRRPGSLPAGWRVERNQGGAGSLFSDSGPAAPAQRLVRVQSVTAPALVLGSTQPASVVRSGAEAVVDVVRRRSGGGAVLLRPGETVWVDVVVPAGDPLWSDDVGRAFWWLGSVWAAALGLGDEAVHRGAMVRTAWSSAVCFAGIGPGEVVVRDGGGVGGKVVGIAARRSRDRALFQCAVPLVWDAAAHVDLLGLPAEAEAALAAVAAPVSRMTADEVVDAFLAALPD
jgi:lipoate-protein ligase A